MTDILRELKNGPVSPERMREIVEIIRGYFQKIKPKQIKGLPSQERLQ